jgi:hypothetical protein
MTDCCGIDAENRQQRRLRWVVFGLNAGMWRIIGDAWRGLKTGQAQIADCCK